MIKINNQSFFNLIACNSFSSYFAQKNLRKKLEYLDSEVLKYFCNNCYLFLNFCPMLINFIRLKIKIICL